MPRLSTLKSSLGSMAPLIARQTDAEGHSRQVEHGRGWYNLAEWKALRVRVFLRDNYTCQMANCGRVTSRPIADHIKPHRGDRALFFADANVQTLCKPCHDGEKQRLERRAARGGG